MGSSTSSVLQQVMREEREEREYARLVDAAEAAKAMHIMTSQGPLWERSPDREQARRRRSRVLRGYYLPPPPRFQIVGQEHDPSFLAAVTERARSGSPIMQPPDPVDDSGPTLASRIRECRLQNLHGDNLPEYGDAVQSPAENDIR